MPSHDVMDGTSVSRTVLQSIPLDQNQSRPVTRPVGRSVVWSHSVDDQLDGEAVMQISGAVTGSWRDGLVTTLWITWWIRDLR